MTCGVEDRDKLPICDSIIVLFDDRLMLTYPNTAPMQVLLRLHGINFLDY